MTKLANLLCYTAGVATGAAVVTFLPIIQILGEEMYNKTFVEGKKVRFTKETKDARNSLPPVTVSTN
jgi:hypothetical protein